MRDEFFIFTVTDNGPEGELGLENAPYASLKALIYDIYGYGHDVARVVKVSLTGQSADVTKEAAEMYAELEASKFECDDYESLPTFPDWVETNAHNACRIICDAIEQGHHEERTYGSYEDQVRSDWRSSR